MEEESCQDEFRLENVSLEFGKCFEGENVRLDKYIDAYNELNRFFAVMGTIFSFITSDVRSKIATLQHYLASDVGDHYTTVEKMIEYEVANGITVESETSGGEPPGSRTLLRLHRALEFIIHLFDEMAQSSANSSESFSALVGRAYNATLANHHPWYVRSAVAVALYAVPSRSSLIQRLDPEGSEERLIDQLNAAVLAMQPVYDRVHASFSDNNLLQLP